MSDTLIQGLAYFLPPFSGIDCFWACASDGTTAHYRAVLGDLATPVPEALADVLDLDRDGADHAVV